MADSSPRTHVHYEIENWHIERRGTLTRGFPLGPADAKASHLAGLQSKYPRMAAKWGHETPYFVNRVSACRVAGALASEPTGFFAPPSTPDLAPSVVPNVGDVTSAYAVVDLASGQHLGAYDSFDKAIALAAEESSSLRRLAVDFVVTERLGLIDPSLPQPVWSSALVEESQAPAVIERETRNRAMSAIGSDRRTEASGPSL